MTHKTPKNKHPAKLKSQTPPELFQLRSSELIPLDDLFQLQNQPDFIRLKRAELPKLAKLARQYHEPYELHELHEPEDLSYSITAILCYTVVTFI